MGFYNYFLRPKSLPAHPIPSSHSSLLHLHLRCAAQHSSSPSLPLLGPWRSLPFSARRSRIIALAAYPIVFDSISCLTALAFFAFRIPSIPSYPSTNQPLRLAC
jgi:hypothetical protein